MSGINLKTPFIFFISILMLTLFSLPDYEKALQGFISETLVISSGFLTLLLSFVLLAMQASEAKRGYEVVGEILSFSYGVFITVLIAQSIQNWELNMQVILIIALTTILVMLVASSLEKKFVWIDSWFENKTNTKAKKFACELGTSFILIMLISFIYWKL